MKLTMIHHLHTATSDNRPCVFDSITLKVNDKPVLNGVTPRVFHSQLDIYKWLLTRQGIEIIEEHIKA